MGISPLKVDEQQSVVPPLTLAHSGVGYLVIRAAGGGVARIGIAFKTWPSKPRTPPRRSGEASAAGEAEMGVARKARRRVKREVVDVKERIFVLCRRVS